MLRKRLSNERRKLRGSRSNRDARHSRVESDYERGIERLKARVLIVDDEPLARDRIREMLRGDEEVQLIREARNGREAIEAVNEHAPDLVFLDIQMPDMDGFDVLKRIDAERMPFVIFVTAFDQYALRAFEVHALDYLMKPF